MTAGSTYTPIATTTLGSAQASFTFNSIPGTYTDLVLITDHATTATTTLFMRFNGDSGSNYSYTQLWAPNGSLAYTQRTANANSIDMHDSTSTVGQNMLISNIMNYSNTTKYKTTLTAANDNANGRRYVDVQIWRNNTAITSITLFMLTGNISAGTTFTLYGIQAA